MANGEEYHVAHHDLQTPEWEGIQIPIPRLWSSGALRERILNGRRCIGRTECGKAVEITVVDASSRLLRYSRPLTLLGRRQGVWQCNDNPSFV